jgi:hypothetical protein|tara:strand:- start:469 stop:678 length:210 start_codon:yes stop_codon:yes gene_type:complete
MDFSRRMQSLRARGDVEGGDDGRGAQDVPRQQARKVISAGESDRLERRSFAAEVHEASRIRQLLGPKRN